MDRVLSTGLFLVVVTIMLPLMAVGVVLVCLWAACAALDHPRDCDGCEDCLGSMAFRSTTVAFPASQAVVEHPTSLAA